MILAATRIAAALFCLSILLTVLMFAVSLRGEATIDDAAGDDYGPCDDPDCGMCHHPCGLPYTTSEGEARDLFEQSVRDALWLSEVDELERMWRA